MRRCNREKTFVKASRLLSKEENSSSKEWLKNRLRDQTTQFEIMSNSNSNSLHDGIRCLCK